METNVRKKKPSAHKDRRNIWLLIITTVLVIGRRLRRSTRASTSRAACPSS